MKNFLKAALFSFLMVAAPQAHAAICDFFGTGPNNEFCVGSGVTPGEVVVTVIGTMTATNIVGPDGTNCLAGSAAGGVGGSGEAQDCTDYSTQVEADAKSTEVATDTTTIQGNVNSNDVELAQIGVDTQTHADLTGAAAHGDSYVLNTGDTMIGDLLLAVGANLGVGNTAPNGLFEVGVGSLVVTQGGLVSIGQGGADPMSMFTINGSTNVTGDFDFDYQILLRSQNDPDSVNLGIKMTRSDATSFYSQDFNMDFNSATGLLDRQRLDIPGFRETIFGITGFVSAYEHRWSTGTEPGGNTQISWYREGPLIGGFLFQSDLGRARITINGLDSTDAFVRIQQAGSDVAALGYDADNAVFRITGAAGDVNGTTGITLDAFDNVGIGNTAPTGLFQVGGGTLTVLEAGIVGINTLNPSGALTVVGLAGLGGNGIFVESYDSTLGGIPFVAQRCANGTIDSPTACLIDETLALYGGAGHTGSVFTGSRATIEMKAAETFTGSANGARIEFRTTPIGSTGRLERMRIDNAGNVGIGTTSPAAELEVVGEVRATTFNAVGSDYRINGVAFIGSDFNLSVASITSTGNHTFNGGFIQLDTTPANPSHNEGQLFYDKSDKSLAYHNDEADITMQVGQEMWLRARNQTGSTILNGQAVFVTGATGGTPTIGLAKADTDLTAQVIGLATHDIENNTIGYVTVFGLVRDMDTSAFSEGDFLHLSTVTAGALVGGSQHVVGPGFDVAVGKVVVANPSNGVILVTPHPHLTVGLGTANQIRAMNSAADAEAFKTLSGTGSEVEISQTDTNITIGLPNSVTVASTLTVAGDAFSVGSSTLAVTSGRVGIGTTEPAVKLHISSGAVIIDGTGASLSVEGSVTANAFFGSAEGISNFTVHASTSLSILDVKPLNSITYVGVATVTMTNVRGGGRHIVGTGAISFLNSSGGTRTYTFRVVRDGTTVVSEEFTSSSGNGNDGSVPIVFHDTGAPPGTVLYSLQAKSDASMTTQESKAIHLHLIEY